MPDPILFIINPVAGSRKNKNRVVEFIKSRFPSQNAAIYFTKGKGDATTIARKAAQNGAAIVVAVGGDGTVNEVASGLLGSKTALAILPRGSGNGLARALKIPFNTNAALGLIEKKTLKRIDIGKAAHRFFCAVSGIGFDAKVSEVFDRSKLRGFLSYVWVVATELRRYVPQAYEIEFDQDKFGYTPFIATVANTPQFGNGAIIAPQARMDDGLLDLCLASSMTWPQILSAVPKLFRGTLDQHTGIDYFKAKKIIFHAAHPIRFHVDGEPEMTDSTLAIEIIPQALTVCVP